MSDLVDRARRIIDALERGDGSAVAAAQSPKLEGWEPGPWIKESWTPRLEAAAGPNRQVVESWRVHDRMARFRVEGDTGQAFLTVTFDHAGLVGLSVAKELEDGGFGICLGCSGDQQDELRTFWTRLVDGALGFGDGAGPAPQWPDPEHPQQLHLDVLVPDLESAETAVFGHGASKLRDSGTFRVYADPVGHPFCLYLDPTVDVADSGRIGVLARVVFDCPDPVVLADFWSGLLDLPERVEQSADRIVIARSDLRLPMIGLQRVANYQPPRWPDPAHPAQLHLDISFDDRESRERLALQLGATRLPPQGGSCPVYADPAGHPFCLCMTGE